MLFTTLQWSALCSVTLIVGRGGVVAIVVGEEVENPRGAARALEGRFKGMSDLAAVGWSGRPGSNRHGQLGRLCPLRRQEPRPAVRPGHSYPLLTVVYRG
jgi:hypothetical protein